MNVEDVLVQGRWGDVDILLLEDNGAARAPRAPGSVSGVRSGESLSSRPRPPCGDASRPGRPSSSRWALPIRTGRHPSKSTIARLLPASPEFRLMQQDESAPSGSSSACPHTIRLASTLVTRVRRLVGLLPRWQPWSTDAGRPSRRRGDVVNQPDSDPGVVAGVRTDGEGSEPGRPPSVPRKRKREVTRRVRKALPEPTPATWIMVAPGRYIRGEEPAPETVIPSPPVEAGEGSLLGSHDLAPQILDEAPSHDQAGHGAPEGEGE